MELWKKEKGQKPRFSLGQYYQLWLVFYGQIWVKVLMIGNNFFRLKKTATFERDWILGKIELVILDCFLSFAIFFCLFSNLVFHAIWVCTENLTMYNKMYSVVDFLKNLEQSWLYLEIGNFYYIKKSSTCICTIFLLRLIFYISVPNHILYSHVSRGDPKYECGCRPKKLQIGRNSSLK